MTKCDECKLAKTPIIYVRSGHKLCRDCYDMEMSENKKLINKMQFVIPWEPLLGYSFVMNEWFSDQVKGRRYTNWVYENFGSVSN